MEPRGKLTGNAREHTANVRGRHREARGKIYEGTHGITDDRKHG